MNNHNGRKLSVQLLIATITTLAGCGLLIAGMIIEPKGEIHNSILVAFGEIATFVSGIMGVDYYYRHKIPEK